MTIRFAHVTMPAITNDDSFDEMPSYVTMWAGHVTIRPGHVTVTPDPTLFKHMTILDAGR
jgi:hypothetical protein